MLLVNSRLRCSFSKGLSFASNSFSTRSIRHLGQVQHSRRYYNMVTRLDVSTTAYYCYLRQPRTLRGSHWTCNKISITSSTTFIASHNVLNNVNRRQSHASSSRSNIRAKPLQQGTGPTIESIEDFKSLAKGRQVTMLDAHTFLKRSFQEIQIQDLPLDQKREAVSKVGAGQILQWVLSQQDLDLDMKFVQLPCWFTHTEGLDDLVAESLMISIRNQQYIHGNKDRFRWRYLRLLYAGVIRANLAWSATSSADSAIVRLRNDVHGLDVTKSREIMAIIPAKVAIEKGLTADRPTPCTTENFTWFVQFHLAALPDDMRVYESALFKMYHPTNADASAMFQFVKEKKSALAPLQPQRTEQQTLVWAERYLFRASFLLRLRGQTQDAEWLDSMLQQGICPTHLLHLL